VKSVDVVIGGIERRTNAIRNQIKVLATQVASEVKNID